MRARLPAASAPAADGSDPFNAQAGQEVDKSALLDQTQQAMMDKKTYAMNMQMAMGGQTMKVSGVDWSDVGHESGRATATVFFTAPTRVDFRQLVRDLAQTIDAKVVLTQLSARDDARVQGGVGSCGRDTCCSTFLVDFEPVTVRMARDQDLPANPMKISGACGRLMCCLKYEHPIYDEFRASTPAVGARVETPDGDGKVIAHDVPRDQVVVRLEAGGKATVCDRASVCASRKAYDSR